VSVDEFPKNDTTIEGLAKLRPAFVRDGSGTVTAGNASGLNDGAAAVVLTSESNAKAKNLTPMARIVAYAQSGVDPAVMGTGPITAVQFAVSYPYILIKTNLTFQITIDLPPLILIVYF